ncbi:zinc induced facilitator 1 protein [Ceratobasidium theobromae]|uniref:Zinc induced facilitator 1 protein n=1 Tax=Ceratobasidium theobromae TaxID=1582974 RepID=A0A5N5QIY5_9AGAM|nr:zinc induced facilitator 1 protein [Ceratobasidium theobromae]
MPGGPVAAQLDEQPLIVEHDAREDVNEPNFVGDASAAKGKRTPTPWRSLLVLTALNAVCPLAFELIYPFVNSMIVEIGVTKDPERVGFYSGLVESIFSLSSLLMILPFGYISDHIGRKPVVLLGLGGLSVSIVCFGLSKSLLGMIMSRCIGGALGASWAAIKVMTGEMTDRSNQDTAFSMMNVSYRLGQIVGLPLGGLLAHPERRWTMFQTPFWNEYPFLLPCLVGAGFSLVSILFGMAFVEETLPSKVKARRKSKQPTYGSTSPTTLESAAPLLNDGELETNKPVQKPTWRTVMTPSIVSLVLNNACMCIASEMLFSLYPLFAFTPITSGGLGMSEAEIGTQMSVRAVVHVGIMLFYAPINRKLGTTRLYQVTMAFWAIVVLGFPFLHWAASRTGIKSVVFNAAQLVFFFTWSICGFAWVCMGSMVTDASPSAEALSLINGNYVDWNVSLDDEKGATCPGRVILCCASCVDSLSYTSHVACRPSYVGRRLSSKHQISPQHITLDTGISQISIVLPQTISPALANSLFAASVDKHIMGGNFVWVLLFVFTCLGFLHSLALKEPQDDWRTKQELDE